jgi:hypothetical protein
MMGVATVEYGPQASVAECSSVQSHLEDHRKATDEAMAITAPCVSRPACAAVASEVRLSLPAQIRKSNGHPMTGKSVQD